jgi:hypothetical protein
VRKLTYEKAQVLRLKVFSKGNRIPGIVAHCIANAGITASEFPLKEGVFGIVFVDKKTLRGKRYVTDHSESMIIRD